MSKVIIKECGSYKLEQLIEKLNSGMEYLGGWDRFIKAGDKVLLKVNLIGPKASDTAAVTHSEFVRALIRILRSKECTVWIGDSSGGAIGGVALTGGSFHTAGYEKTAQEEGAVIKNFDKEGVVEVAPESKCEDIMYLAKPIFDADVVINLPKLKTHTSGIYTGAVKNVFGCVPGLRKAKYHKMAPNPESFGEILADIHKAVSFQLHIMDGITAMQGEGPTAGEVYNANKILISNDPLALDTVAMQGLGLKLEEIPILHAAQKRNIGEYKLENIEILGDYNTMPKLENFKLPQIYRSTKKRNYNALSKVIDFLKARPSINSKKCKGCNICVESCPVEAINRNTKAIDYNKCIECMCCHELCMHKAVELRKVNPIARVASKLYRGKYR